MAQDALLKVKEAEDKCALMISNANEKAKSILDEAKAEGEQEYKAAIAVADKLRHDFVERAVDDAMTQSAAITAVGEAGLAKIKSPDSGEFDQVVALVVERIVNTHGNS